MKKTMDELAKEFPNPSRPLIRETSDDNGKRPAKGPLAELARKYDNPSTPLLKK